MSYERIDRPFTGPWHDEGSGCLRLVHDSRIEYADIIDLGAALCGRCKPHVHEVCPSCEMATAPCTCTAGVCCCGAAISRVEGTPR